MDPEFVKEGEQDKNLVNKKTIEKFILFDEKPINVWIKSEKFNFMKLYFWFTSLHKDWNSHYICDWGGSPLNVSVPALNEIIIKFILYFKT